MTVVTARAVSTGKAFCPGHITGFLSKTSGLTGFKEKLKKGSANLHVGSLGAGLAINLGINTTVKVFDKTNNGNSGASCDVLVNGLIQNSNIEVTNSVLEKYIDLLQGKSYYVRIEHETAIPIGYGLSSSGAAALSLSYALNTALRLGLDKVQAAQIAHCSEIECKTGLGSVLAQYVGGFEMRSAVGAPGIGVVEKIRCPSTLGDLRVVILCLSPVSTKKFLTEHAVNGFGEKMLGRLSVSRDIGDFLDISFDFANRLGLIRGRSQRLINRLRSQGFACSIALFGETIFSIVNSSDVEDVVSCLKGHGGRFLVSGIDLDGARVIEKE